MKRFLLALLAAISLVLTGILPASATPTNEPSIVISSSDSASNVRVYDEDSSAVVKRGGYLDGDPTWTGFYVGRGVDAKVYPADERGAITGPASQFETKTGKHAFKAGTAEFVVIKTVKDTKPAAAVRYGVRYNAQGDTRPVLVNTETSYYRVNAYADKHCKVDRMIISPGYGSGLRPGRHSYRVNARSEIWVSGGKRKVSAANVCVSFADQPVYYHKNYKNYKNK